MFNQDILSDRFSKVHPPPKLRSSDDEREQIITALKLNNGHRENTTRYLGISRRTLQYKLKRYGLK
ncbi:MULTISPECIES: helix-turn-helix domain-containing protein [Intestinimonas]|uniref:helix-turn-helix domain-containing protein n=1 Tax=Intestinimonas TaxID=1392389 RepID=UPI001A916956|nr:helix-turn-helix domain-containing protein [Intestinimonas butyriciproducens]MBS6523947.1 hypothetical protein [Clostridiales bacterium]MCR1907278.1 hypothetical protein [Intestinimonas butyriciproducens]MDY3616291.1 helix-turn-helix domain-containing protein [Intestinimonas butyriciproducens]